MNDAAIIAGSTEAERRRANRDHRGEVNRDAAAAIRKVMEDADLGAGAFPRLAQLVVIAIAQGSVPGVTISY